MTMTDIEVKPEVVEESLTQMTVRFATKRQEMARWNYSLACNKARLEYQGGTERFLESILGTLDAIPGTVKYDRPEDLVALQTALEVAVAVQEEVQDNFYREIHEAEAELNWSLSKLAEENRIEQTIDTTIGEIEPIL